MPALGWATPFALVLRGHMPRMGWGIAPGLAVAVLGLVCGSGCGGGDQPTDPGPPATESWTLGAESAYPVDALSEVTVVDTVTVGDTEYAVHSVPDPAAGTVGNYLAGYTWYDAAGQVIKQQAPGQRAFSKTQYDGLGRATKQLVGYDLSEIPGATLSSSSSSSSIWPTCLSCSTMTSW